MKLQTSAAYPMSQRASGIPRLTLSPTSGQISEDFLQVDGNPWSLAPLITWHDQGAAGPRDLRNLVPVPSRPSTVR